MQFEIKREDLLKLKQTNYDLYQLIMSQKSLDGDYCETLDKEKLAKECELGYFKIEDLFTKKQITEAYQNNQKSKQYSLVEEIKKAAREDLISSVFGFSRYSEGSGASDSPIAIPQKKHAKLLQQIDEFDVCVFIETKDQLEHVRFQGELVELGLKWRDGSKFERKYEKYLILNLGFGEGRVICHTSTCDIFTRKMLRKYDLKTEQFIN